MRLKELELLSEFRGLPAGYTISFNKTSSRENTETGVANFEPICLVGLNGSGKSNILEVLAEIFYYLESYTKADRFQRNGLHRFKSGFGFNISYELPSAVALEGIQDWPELQDMLGNSTKQPPAKAGGFEIRTESPDTHRLNDAS